MILDICIGGMQEHQAIKTDGYSPMVSELGFIDKGTGKHESNIVYDSDGVAPCVTASYGVKQPPAMHIDVKEVGTTHPSHGWLDINADFSGVAPTIDAGISKQHTLAIEKQTVQIRQATKEGSIPCKIGGGGRFTIPNIPNTQGKSNRSRECSTNADNGEYP